MKYRMTQTGRSEFIGNRKQYLSASIESKIMNLMSSGVEYTLDSITAQVLLDPRLKARIGQVLGALGRLQDKGYIEVI